MMQMQNESEAKQLFAEFEGYYATSSNSCRENASLLFRSAVLQSAREKLKSLLME